MTAAREEEIRRFAEANYASVSMVNDLLALVEAVRADMKGIIAGNAQGAVSARNQIHRLLDASEVAPAPDYMTRIATLIRERDSLVAQRAHVTDEDIAWLREEEWQHRQRAGDLERDAKECVIGSWSHISALQRAKDVTAEADRFKRLLEAFGGHVR